MPGSFYSILPLACPNEAEDSYPMSDQIIRILQIYCTHCSLATPKIPNRRIA